MRGSSGVREGCGRRSLFVRWEQERVCRRIPESVGLASRRRSASRPRVGGVVVVAGCAWGEGWWGGVGARSLSSSASSCRHEGRGWVVRVRAGYGGDGRGEGGGGATFLTSALISLGAFSTSSFASFSPRPVRARTSLMTCLGVCVWGGLLREHNSYALRHFERNGRSSVLPQPEAPRSYPASSSRWTGEGGLCAGGAGWCRVRAAVSAKWSSRRVEPSVPRAP